MQRAAQAYFQTQVTTTSQGDIVVMLYDGAIKFLNQAKTYLADNDMAQKGMAISKALDVINELDGSLNMEKGGSLSDNLHNLYLFCSKHLVMANLRKDPERIEQVIKILSGLRSAYSEILDRPEAQAAAQQAAANMRATAIMPGRVNAGQSTSGTVTHAVNAGARMRAMYAKQQAELESVAPGMPEPQSALADDAAPPEPTEQAGQIAQVPAATAESAPAQAFPLNLPTGFGKRLQGADAYRKFSG